MGVAYLPDGTLIDYQEYISTHPHWKKVREARFEFDNGCCAICHKDLHGCRYETHHLSYQRLGHERIRDVITMCHPCHDTFHQNWSKQQFWKGKEKGHWQVYDLEHTARLCAAYYENDRMISRNPKDPNLCGKEASRQLLDDYFRDFNLATHPIIDPYDVSLFIRNKRYELFFEAESRGLTVEEFLDEYYGKKERGKNPLRQEAGRKNGPFDHTPESFHRHYNENKNILILMEEAKKYEISNQKKHEGDAGETVD